MKESRSYSSVRRTKNWVKNGIRSPYNIMVAAAVAALACLVIVPLIEMVVTTFKLAARDVRRVEGPRRGTGRSTTGRSCCAAKSPKTCFTSR